MGDTASTEATDLNRRRRMVCVSALASGVLGLGLFPQRASAQWGVPIGSERRMGGRKQVALIVGNASYGGASLYDWRRLTNPANDARALAAKLKEFGFDCEVEIDLTASGIRSAVSRLVARAQGAQTVLFYYSGHGAGIGDTNYLIPVDASPIQPGFASIRAEGVPLADVIRPLMYVPKATKLVFLDACRSLPDAGPQSHSQKGGEYSGGLVSITAPPDDTVIVFATDAGRTADDTPNAPIGAYMQGLLHAFNTTRRMSLGAILAATDRKVAELTRSQQIPKSYGRDSTKEDYWFRVEEYRDLAEPDWGGKIVPEFPLPRRHQ